MKNHTNYKIFILAGESSGDYHGSKLMYYMKRSNPEIEFIGIGGTLMQSEGLQSLVSLRKIAVMGFWEVFKKIFFFLKLEKKILTCIIKQKPNKVILIDYPGLNLRLSKKIKSYSNVPIIYYISPQIWAWKEKRVHIVKKYIDTLIVLFPFEKDWYQRYQIPVQYFGHPLIHQAKQYAYNPLKKKNIYNVAFCPGSRDDEINKHLPVLEQLLQQQKAIKGSIKVTIIKSTNTRGFHFKQLLNTYRNLTITEAPLLEALQNCDFAIIASGTATLECAAAYRPMVVIYKMSWISWLITKKFINIKFAAMVNVIAKQRVVPELLQSQLTPYNLIQHVNRIIYNIESNILDNKLKSVIDTLDNGNSYKQTSNYILDYEK